jgi:hypothetical protein
MSLLPRSQDSVDKIAVAQPSKMNTSRFARLLCSRIPLRESTFPICQGSGCMLLRFVSLFVAPLSSTDMGDSICRS